MCWPGEERERESERDGFVVIGLPASCVLVHPRRKNNVESRERILAPLNIPTWSRLSAASEAPAASRCFPSCWPVGGWVLATAGHRQCTLGNLSIMYVRARSTGQWALWTVHPTGGGGKLIHMLFTLEIYTDWKTRPKISTLLRLDPLVILLTYLVVFESLSLSLSLSPSPSLPPSSLSLSLAWLCYSAFSS